LDTKSIFWTLIIINWAPNLEDLFLTNTKFNVTSVGTTIEGKELSFYIVTNFSQNKEEYDRRIKASAEEAEERKNSYSYKILNARNPFKIYYLIVEEQLSSLPDFLSSRLIPIWQKGCYVVLVGGAIWFYPFIEALFKIMWWTIVQPSWTYSTYALNKMSSGAQSIKNMTSRSDGVVFEVNFMRHLHSMKGQFYSIMKRVVNTKGTLS
jgi:hypothetical protein